MPAVECPQYELTGEHLVFRPVRVALAPEEARRLANFGPEALSPPAPEPVPPVSVGGPLALARHAGDDVVVRHGPKDEVLAWLAWNLERRPADPPPIEIVEFPATSLGVQAINARLRTAFLRGRLLWGAGPGERPWAEKAM